MLIDLDREYTRPHVNRKTVLEGVCSCQVGVFVSPVVVIVDIGQTATCECTLIGPQYVGVPIIQPPLAKLYSR